MTHHDLPGAITGELQQYERDTWYDQNGRIVFTASKGLTGRWHPTQGSAAAANKTTLEDLGKDLPWAQCQRTIHR